jgi:TPR repeat protein
MTRPQAAPSDVSAAQPSPSQIANAQPREAPVSQPPSMKTQTTASPLSADEIAALLSRSDDFLKHGDFAAARILLRRAAESGSANAALVLGKSFDPLFLHELGAIGIQPDIAQSRQWYEKAAELGSEAAAQRLANLAQTGQ